MYMEYLRYSTPNIFKSVIKMIKNITLLKKYFENKLYIYNNTEIINSNMYFLDEFEYWYILSVNQKIEVVDGMFHFF